VVDVAEDLGHVPGVDAMEVQVQLGRAPRVGAPAGTRLAHRGFRPFVAAFAALPLITPLASADYKVLLRVPSPYFSRFGIEV
jgi:hypothetical protein